MGTIGTNSTLSVRAWFDYIVTQFKFDGLHTICGLEPSGLGLTLPHCFQSSNRQNRLRHRLRRLPIVVPSGTLGNPLLDEERRMILLLVPIRVKT